MIFVPFNQTNKDKEKYIIITRIPKLLWKKFHKYINYFFVFSKCKNDKFIVKEIKTNSEK